MQMNSSWSQDTGYSSSWSSSDSSLASDIQDRLTIKSQRDLQITLEKRPRQQCPLPNSTSMVSITNNHYYLGPEPFFTDKPRRSLSFPLRSVEVSIQYLTCKMTTILDPCKILHLHASSQLYTHDLLYVQAILASYMNPFCRQITERSPSQLIHKGHDKPSKYKTVRRI